MNNYNKTPDTLTVHEASVKYNVSPSNLLDSIYKGHLSCTYSHIRKNKSPAHLLNIEQLESFLSRHPKGKIFTDKSANVEKINSKITNAEKNRKRIDDILFERTLEEKILGESW